MWRPTIIGTACGRWRTPPRIAPIRPKVATDSAKIWAGPSRSLPDTCRIGSANMAWAAHTPATAPAVWTAI